MKRTRIKPISDKQKEKNRIWNKITDEVCEELGYICQYCGKKGQRTVPERFDYLDGHHIIKRSQGGRNVKGNCCIAHRIPCHRYIDDHNVRVAIGDYKTRVLFI